MIYLAMLPLVIIHTHTHTYEASKLEFGQYISLALYAIIDLYFLPEFFIYQPVLDTMCPRIVI